MTEEIIDITKCEFNTFDGGGSQRTICTLDNCFCDGLRPKECYFKQLQKLKQENKELKKQIESQKGLITVGGKQQCQYLQKIDELEQENKELKEKYSHVLELAKTNADSNEYCLQELEKENKKLLDARNHFMAENLKYFNALEEIKNSVINYLPKENYKFAKSFNPEKFELLENILTRINEALK